MHDIPETGFLRLPQVLSVIPLGKTMLVGRSEIGTLSEASKVVGTMHGLAG